MVYASSRCADLISSSSKEQSVLTSKEQSAQAHFGSGSESTFYGKNVPPLLSSSSKNSFGSSSSNVFEPSLTSDALDFYANSTVPKDGTKNFQSYIGELLEKRIIGDSELIRFIEHLEKGELINLISEDEALTSTSLLVQRRGLQSIWTSLHSIKRDIGLVESHSCKKGPCSSETGGDSGRNSVSEVRVSSCEKTGSL